MKVFERHLLLLTAPPASGKTYWIQSLIKELNEAEIIMISPLRALADECKRNWGKDIEIMTPEEWISKKLYKKIVIFDEFHLNFYWGDSFRPLMWEVFYDLASEAELTVLLTATISESMKKDLTLYEPSFDSITWVDQGNQQLKYNPTKYLKLGSQKDIHDLIRLTKPNTETSLIFCAYRKEVFKVERELSSLGFKVWSCVGGEAGAFSQRVSVENPPDFIICTTVLSHGVNLPKVSTIYFLYEVANIDFWIQMVARGGRRGEKFRVFSLEKPYGIKWNWWINSLGILSLRFRIWYDQAKRQTEQWFLKD